MYIYERWSDKEIIDYEGIQEFEPTSIELVGLMVSAEVYSPSPRPPAARSPPGCSPRPT